MVATSIEDAQAQLDARAKSIAAAESQLKLISPRIERSAQELLTQTPMQIAQIQTLESLRAKQLQQAQQDLGLAKTEQAQAEKEFQTYKTQYQSLQAEQNRIAQARRDYEYGRKVAAKGGFVSLSESKNPNIMAGIKSKPQNISVEEFNKAQAHKYYIEAKIKSFETNNPGEKILTDNFGNVSIQSKLLGAEVSPEVYNIAVNELNRRANLPAAPAAQTPSVASSKFDILAREFISDVQKNPVISWIGKEYTQGKAWLDRQTELTRQANLQRGGLWSYGIQDKNVTAPTNATSTSWNIWQPITSTERLVTPYIPPKVKSYLNYVESKNPFTSSLAEKGVQFAEPLITMGFFSPVMRSTTSFYQPVPTNVRTTEVSGKSATLVKNKLTEKPDLSLDEISKLESADRVYKSSFEIGRKKYNAFTFESGILKSDITGLEGTRVFRGFVENSRGKIVSKIAGQSLEAANADITKLISRSIIENPKIKNIRLLETIEEIKNEGATEWTKVISPSGQPTIKYSPGQLDIMRLPPKQQIIGTTSEARFVSEEILKKKNILPDEAFVKRGNQYDSLFFPKGEMFQEDLFAKKFAEGKPLETSKGMRKVTSRYFVSESAPMEIQGVVIFEEKGGIVSKLPKEIQKSKSPFFIKETKIKGTRTFSEVGTLKPSEFIDTSTTQATTTSSEFGGLRREASEYFGKGAVVEDMFLRTPPGFKTMQFLSIESVPKARVSSYLGLIPLTKVMQRQEQQSKLKQEFNLMQISKTEQQQRQQQRQRESLSQEQPQLSQLRLGQIQIQPQIQQQRQQQQQRQEQIPGFFQGLQSVRITRLRTNESLKKNPFKNEKRKNLFIGELRRRKKFIAVTKPLPLPQALALTKKKALSSLGVTIRLKKEQGGYVPLKPSRYFTKSKTPFAIQQKTQRQGLKGGFLQSKMEVKEIQQSRSRKKNLFGI